MTRGQERELLGLCADLTGRSSPYLSHYADILPVSKTAINRWLTSTQADVCIRALNRQREEKKRADELLDAILIEQATAAAQRAANRVNNAAPSEHSGPLDSALAVALLGRAVRLTLASTNRVRTGAVEAIMLGPDGQPALRLRQKARFVVVPLADVRHVDTQVPAG